MLKMSLVEIEQKDTVYTKVDKMIRLHVLFQSNIQHAIVIITLTNVIWLQVIYQSQSRLSFFLCFFLCLFHSILVCFQWI